MDPHKIYNGEFYKNLFQDIFILVKTIQTYGHCT